ncbi:tumor necrosis factor receptor superfamily member 11B-like isoform X2 [Echeneis naucrates]|uniref:tumor necrosis factor receptor superfamily member 11B-like isoform X2 n=1 Tax=Echeneis naucrates TaxID=173247 RepID=UPI0011136C2B|nr:tumor necrosis factor receptor superfamily member 11B-like isoform X2 [Echeneis naucrates]
MEFLLSSQMFFYLLLLFQQSSAGSDASSRTFTHTDPVTGQQLTCDRCPPGTFMRARCTATSRSDCAPCQPGSFTEMWNYIGKCLRCGVCSHNEVVKSACNASSDCLCGCKQGFYWRAELEMCVRHRQCQSGHGVLSSGTADKDTVCYACPDGTFSTSSAQQNCTEHRSCQALGQELLLRGSTWHDSIYGTAYLKEILPAFFLHHKLSVRRFRRFIHTLPLRSSDRPVKALPYDQFNAWVASATLEEVQELPAVLIQVGAAATGERLRNKLHRIESNLIELCSSRNTNEVY